MDLWVDIILELGIQFVYFIMKLLIGVCKKLDSLFILFAYLTFIFKETIEYALALITLLCNLLLNFFFFFLLALFCYDMVSDFRKVLLKISQLFDEEFLHIVELSLSLL